MERYRPTPDITIDGRMMNGRDYRLHLDMLQDLKAGRSVQKYMEGPDEIYRVWRELPRQGLVRQNPGSYRMELTPYGRLYLDQRLSRTSRDAPRGYRPKRSRRR